MEDFGVLLVVLVAGALALVQIRRDPRIDRRFVARSIAAAVGYLVALAAAGGLLVALAPTAGPRLLAAMAFMAAWFVLATLWLMRLAPRTRTPPGFLMRRWGVLDGVLIAVCVLAFGYVLVAPSAQ